MAAPSKYSPERAQAIADTLAAGNTLNVAAVVNGITYETLNEWRKEKPEFSDMLTRAEALAEEFYAGAIQRAARDADNWQAAKFWLTHRKGHNWQPPPTKTQIGGDPDNPTPLVIERTVYAPPKEGQ